MDELLCKQSALSDQLATIKRNYTKTAHARRTRGYIKNQLIALANLWQEYNSNDAMLRLCKGFSESDYALDSVYDIAQDSHSLLLGELEDIVDSIDLHRQRANFSANQTQSSTSQTQHPQPTTPSIRLPQITLPTFSGDYSSWSAFHDMFVSLIHNNGTLTNVQKLHYLKTNLRDQAAQMLRHTQITNESYEVAWEALKTRYANKRILVNTQMQLLVNQSSHHTENAQNIRAVIDTSTDCMNALRALKVDTETWDPILLFILVQKISATTHAAWELDQEGENELPSYDAFIEFLENRFRMLESLATRTQSSPHAKPATRQLKSHAVLNAAVSTTAACPICSGDHYVRACPTFSQMSINDRRSSIKQHKICFNCLTPGHLVSECRNKMNCRTCNKRHHSLLHDPQSQSAAPAQPHHSSAPHHSSTQSPQQSSSSPAHQLRSSAPPTHSHAVQSIAPSSPSSAATQQVSSHIAAPSTTSHVPSSPAHVLLATAMITAVASTGERTQLRALIDQGSQVSFISENAAQLLRLKSTPTDWSISGIGSTNAGRVRNIVQIQLRSSQHADFAHSLNALVIKTITGLLPPARCQFEQWPHIQDIVLADQSFNSPGPIDVLLGADIYPEIIRPGLIRGPVGTPIAQCTVFGWILSGPTTSSERYDHIQNQLSAMHTCIEIDARLKSFWEIEHNITAESTYTDQETQCERHYAETHSRASDGRYVVRLPVRENSQLGESRSSALNRFMQIERRLQTNDTLRCAYIDFMREYSSLGHMRVSEPQENAQVSRYFIPHHAVFKDSSTTTKVRVVFDASAKSTNGFALNEIMLIGPKIQDDLSVILLRWRKFPIAFIADVEKMYRQILVHNSDQHLQQIFWRESPQDPLREYTLQTVTYGTSCAPYLAVRTLRQLAIDHEHAHAAASKITREDFYVDDLMSGAYSTDAAITIRRQLCELMSAGGLKLRKWVSNNSILLDDVPSCDRELQHPLTIDLSNTVTALGIIWNPATDKFHFKLNLPESSNPPTKRNVLSDISKLFDPLGWLAPTIVRAKILMQKLWLQGVSWDENLPSEVVNYWQIIRNDLFNVSQITIDRWIQHTNSPIELHGFSDASNCAYAAAIYARIQLPDGQYSTTLLTAKTRVAPLKQITIPRLELCGAALVAELLHKTKLNLRIDDINIFAWTDSSIVLHWIRAQPSRWKTFVANRVSTIQELVPMTSWRHVRTNDNPADCASRGLDAASLNTFTLWWKGPTWLAQSPECWPQQDHISRDDNIDDPEQRIITTLSTPTHSPPSLSTTLLQSHSSLQRLLRVFSYCRRFITCHNTSKPNHRSLTAAEIQKSLTHFIMTSQQNTFEKEIKIIKQGHALPTNSKLISLNPILDNNGILRVGGRLKNSNLQFDEKHPIIIHHNCHLATLIIRQLHFATLHGGAQLLLGLLRKQYWITNARDKVRHHIHRCITCHRFNAASASQLMGDLPQPRVTITRAFTHTGIDYAGPIELRMSKGRGNKSYKGYISLFVCMCTKAIHIEAVSDLTSAGFIAAYRRFVARRGLPSHVYSDNGTNFIGAAKTLKQTHDQIAIEVTSEIIDTVTHANTQWHFIPPSSPHFGGLWEAGVKSLKHHLKRTIGDVKLTYEELSTMLTQIEACLNSRPLTQISSDPEDLTVLTPGHFLIGNALLAAPDTTTEPTNISLLTRWQLVQRLYQNICTRWKLEYLSRLQQRPKWTKPEKNLKVGDLILLKESSLPPSSWPLARILQIHPGTDGNVRVVTVRTSKSTFKRCITKVCPLPQ